MLCETDIVVSWRSRPQGFAALMSLYESNYLRLRRLAGEPARLSGTLTSRVSGDCELQLSVIEHMRYTSTLALTYLLPERQASAPQRLPDLKLRVYHDARLLEVEAVAPQHNSRTLQGPEAPSVLRPARERELHQRWMRNMMLNKWLEYCADRGHRFTG